MEAAWTDGDVLSENEWNWGDELPKDLIQDDGELALGSAHRCDAFKAWCETPSKDADAWVEWKRAAQRFVPVVAEAFRPLVLTTWTYCEPVERLRSSTWEALQTLREVLDELVAEPPLKPQERVAVAAELDAHLERLSNLRHRLPHQGDDDSGYRVDDDVDEDGPLVVDWRELNRTQLGGWASPVQDENGSLLAAYRPASFGTAPLEVEDDEPFSE